MPSRTRQTTHEPTRGGDVSAGAGVILRCTSKALSVLVTRPAALTEIAPDENDWYLNLLWIERRKCLLLTHAGTLFSVVLTDVRAADLRPIGPAVVNAIEAALDDEGLPRDTLGALDPEAAILARTASRAYRLSSKVESGVGVAAGRGDMPKFFLGSSARKNFGISVERHPRDSGWAWGRDARCPRCTRTRAGHLAKTASRSVLAS